MKLEWSGRATRRLIEIYDFIAKDSLERATIVTNTLVDGAEQLSRYPFSGPVLPEDGAYRQLVIDGYRIIYRVADKTVYLVTIVSPGMLAQSAL